MSDQAQSPYPPAAPVQGAPEPTAPTAPAAPDSTPPAPAECKVGQIVEFNGSLGMVLAVVERATADGSSTKAYRLGSFSLVTDPVSPEHFETVS